MHSHFGYALLATGGSLMKPIVWTIAGSDSGGGAGIQADHHTFQALNTFGCSVITTVTAQNSFQVDDLFVLPERQIQAQINTLMNDLPPRAIKLGLLGDIHVIHTLK